MKLDLPMEISHNGSEYTATSPVFPGLEGRDPVQAGAFDELREAIQEWMDELEKRGS